MLLHILSSTQCHSVWSYILVTADGSYCWNFISLEFCVPAYDIALLRLEQPLGFDDKVGALCVSELPQLTGVDAIITRWGYVEHDGMQTVGILREAQV